MIAVRSMCGGWCDIGVSINKRPVASLHIKKGTVLSVTSVDKFRLT